VNKNRLAGMTLAALTAAAVLPLSTAPASAATTCKTHSVDGVSIGVCADTLGTNYEVQGAVYVNSTNKYTNTDKCSLYVELWSEDGQGKIESDWVTCVGSNRQHGSNFRIDCGASYSSMKVHADAYLEATNGNFRVGPSATVTIKKSGCN
jgi:hypothetical protein